MDINISNFKKLKKSIDELLQLKRIYVEILEQLEEKIDFCDISWSCYLLEKYEQDLLFTDADFDHITESQEKEKAAALACDALIDEIAAQDLLIENNLYNDYILSVA